MLRGRGGRCGMRAGYEFYLVLVGTNCYFF